MHDALPPSFLSLADVNWGDAEPLAWRGSVAGAFLTQTFLYPAFVLNTPGLGTVTVSVFDVPPLAMRDVQMFRRLLSRFLAFEPGTYAPHALRLKTINAAISQGASALWQTSLMTPTVRAAWPLALPVIPLDAYPHTDIVHAAHAIMLRDLGKVSPHYDQFGAYRVVDATSVIVTVTTTCRAAAVAVPSLTARIDKEMAAWRLEPWHNDRRWLFVPRDTETGRYISWWLAMFTRWADAHRAVIASAIVAAWEAVWGPTRMQISQYSESGIQDGEGVLHFAYFRRESSVTLFVDHATPVIVALTPAAHGARTVTQHEEISRQKLVPLW